MWGTLEAWRQSAPGERQCWDLFPGGSDPFFHSVGGAHACDVNWLEGASGPWGTPLARAPFQQTVS